MSLELWKKIYSVVINPVLILSLHKMPLSLKTPLQRIPRLGQGSCLAFGIQTTGHSQQCFAVKVAARKRW